MQFRAHRPVITRHATCECSYIHELDPIVTLVRWFYLLLNPIVIFSMRMVPIRSLIRVFVRLAEKSGAVLIRVCEKVCEKSGAVMKAQSGAHTHTHGYTQLWFLSPP